MLTLTQILHAFQIGTFAYIVSSELIKPKHLLRFWFVWLEKLEKKKPHLAYPLGYCEKCFAGQIALWYFLITQKFNFINLILFITFAILTPIILKKLFWTEVKQTGLERLKGITILDDIRNRRKIQNQYIKVNESYKISFKDNDNPFDKNQPMVCKIISIKKGFVEFVFINNLLSNLLTEKQRQVTASLPIEHFKRRIL